MGLDRIEPAQLTRRLGGKWHGYYGVAPCPCCQPERRKDQTALTLSNGRDGRLLAHCKRAECDFRDILAALGLSATVYRTADPQEVVKRKAQEMAEAKKNATQAKRCWEETQPIAGTLAETYLRNRAITCALPDTLRFHPECWHGPTACRLPAMVARIDGTDGFAIHRTYLTAQGRKASVSPAKMMLGKSTGGAVSVFEHVGSLVVAEGIETALSLSSGLMSTPATVWASLSTSGMVNLSLPSRTGKLIVALDGDDAGQSAAFKLAERASALGWQVGLLAAPQGCDWNDVLARKEAAT